MIKRFSLLFLALSLFACSDANKTDTKAAPVPAASVEKYIEGTHYTLINKPVVTEGDKIVVTEFFWYGCPHCEHFEPMLEAWQQKMPADVTLNRSPAVWREPMKLHAKVFYLVQGLPNAAFVHPAVFAEVIALHEEQDMDVQSRKLAQFLSKFGVSEADYNARIQSPDIEARMEAAIALMQQVGINGTPAIMVNGKYLVNNEAVGSMEEILAIADFLIAKERK